MLQQAEACVFGEAAISRPCIAPQDLPESKSPRVEMNRYRSMQRLVEWSLSSRCFGDVEAKLPPSDRGQRSNVGLLHVSLSGVRTLHPKACS